MNSIDPVSSFSLIRGARKLAVPLAIATLVASCGERQQQGGGPPPPAVTVAKPIKRTVVDYDEYVGRFTAAANDLVSKGYLLSEDLADLIKHVIIFKFNSEIL